VLFFLDLYARLLSVIEDTYNLLKSRARKIDGCDCRQAFKEEVTISRKYKIAVMPGDGIGPEVTAEAVKVLKATDVNFKFLPCSVGGKEYLQSGEPIPPHAIETVNEADAVLFGAVGHDDAPYDISRKVLVYLRMEKDAYANLRPLKLYPGLSPPHTQREIDVVIVRDNAEGFSLTHSGRLGNTMGTDQRVITSFGANRIIYFAYKHAIERNRRKITCVDQSSWLYSDKLFRRSFRNVSDKYPSLAKEHVHVDVAAMMLARHPEKFDVIVTPDIYGDILSGVIIGHIGGVGMAPSACIGDRFAYFEPVHGTAWDIAGKGIANPIASILSAKLMLEWLGLNDKAWFVETAVDEVLTEGELRTPDLGGDSRTTEVGDAIAKKVMTMEDERREYQSYLAREGNINELIHTQDLET